MEGHDYIFGDSKIPDPDFVPNTIEFFHDTKKVEFPFSRSRNVSITDTMQIFGEHYGKLQQLKRIYDPGNRLKGPIGLDIAA